MNQTGRGLVAGLALTETVSWGVLYYAFPVLLPTMERDLGWSRATLVGAFTLAVIVSGLAALPVGKALDRHPPQPLMTAGSMLAVGAVMAWAASSSPLAFYAAWVAVGVAMALVLYEPAQVVLVKRFGQHASRAITNLTLVAGFASTIFQPVTAALSDRYGWRTALVVLALVLAGVTVPLHLLVLPRSRPTPSPPRSRAHDQRPGARDVRLLTVAFTLASASMAAAIVHLVPFLVDHGWSTVTAAWAAGILGATQVAARVAFGPAARRLPIATLATGVLALPAAGALVLAFSAGRPIVWAAVALLGAGQGTTTLLRPTLLSQRHGPDGYGRSAATSAATSTVARATAPLALAAIAGTGGRHYTAGLIAFAALGVAGALVARYATGRPHEDASPHHGGLPAHT